MGANRDPENISTDTGSVGRRALARALPWCVAVVESPDAAMAGHRAAVTKSLTLGRAAKDVDLVIDDSLLSRRHLTISGDDNEEGWTVEDHGSKNGVFVEGVRVKGRARLRHGSLLRAGATFFEFSRSRLEPPGAGQDPELLGRASAHLRVLHSLRTVAPSEVAVLLVGETGTGKELVARRMHALSGRSGAFVSVNCAAIPPQLAESHLFGHRKGAFTGASGESRGCVRSAEGGTLFLDEVGELTPELQPKLLRVLENHEVTPVGSATAIRCNVRVVAATNADLRAAVAAGDFRMDLYARLAGFRMELPPLRARRGDVPLLLRHFLAEYAPDWQVALEPEFLEALMLAEWPMNVRQLRTFARQITLLQRERDVLELGDVPQEIREGGLVFKPAAETTRAQGAAPTREALVVLLEHHCGNVVQVAKHLAKDRTQIYRWMKKYGLSADSFRRAEDE